MNYRKEKIEQTNPLVLVPQGFLEDQSEKMNALLETVNQLVEKVSENNVKDNLENALILLPHALKRKDVIVIVKCVHKKLTDDIDNGKLIIPDTGSKINKQDLVVYMVKYYHERAHELIELSNLLNKALTIEDIEAFNESLKNQSLKERKGR